MFTSCTTLESLILRREIDWDIMEGMFNSIGMDPRTYREKYDTETEWLLANERWKQPYAPGDYDNESAVS